MEILRKLFIRGGGGGEIFPFSSRIYFAVSVWEGCASSILKLVLMDCL